ncbi:reverse transcriptase domain-containing protein [Tanacetum coccineum]
MVTTPCKTSDDDVPNFEAMITTVANALPNLSAALRTQITNDIRNGAGASGGGGGDNATPQGIHVWIERVTKLKPLAFRFTATPAKAEDWITHMEKLFQVLGCPDNFKTRLAAFKLEGDALSWWKAHLHTQVGGDAFADTCTWVAFREIFYNRYFPASEQQRYEREPRGKLDNSNVGAKEGWCFGPDRSYEINTNVRRANRRTRVVMTRVSMSIGVIRTRVLSIGVVRIGVMIRNDRIFGVRIRGSAGQRRSTETLPPPPLCTTCGKPHPGVCYKATGGCFTCGSTQHKTRDQAAKTSGTITGILYIDDRTIFILFDTGATHSIISTTFAKKLNMTPTPLIERVIISTPMKNHMLIDHEYVNCPIRFDDRIHHANLLPIHMLDFDVILGMDWLASHRATIDCYARTVIFGNVRQPEFVYHGSSPLKSVKLISAMNGHVP